MANTSSGKAVGFDVGRAWAMDDRVALRDEEFGALAYHYGNRRLVFLKSRELVGLLRCLGEHPSAASAIAATVGADRASSYEEALARLAASEVICVR